MSENLPANTFEPDTAKDDKHDDEDDRINQLRQNTLKKLMENRKPAEIKRRSKNDRSVNDTI